MTKEKYKIFCVFCDLLAELTSKNKLDWVFCSAYRGEMTVLQAEINNCQIILTRLENFSTRFTVKIGSKPVFGPIDLTDRNESLRNLWNVAMIKGIPNKLAFDQLLKMLQQ